MIEIDWIEIPAGQFTCGISEKQVDLLLSRLPEHVDARQQQWLRTKLLREAPERVVTIDRFYISRYPITNRQYLEFAYSNHRYSDSNVFSGQDRKTVLEGKQRLTEREGEHPTDSVWHSALGFCDWIGARLPTSVEWEKAARGTDGWLYPWGNTWDASRGNFTLDQKRRRTKTSAVNAYPSGQSPYGVMDMMGNMYEWTLSTMLGIGEISPQVITELVICRSCSCDFSMTDIPDWFRNRVTAIMGNEMYFGGAHLVGFRPVLDEWQRRCWPGLTQIANKSVGASGDFLADLLLGEINKND